MEGLPEDLQLATGFDFAELDTLINLDFEPSSENEQSKLDAEKKIVCPECGHEWSA